MTAAGWPASWVRERLGYEPRDLALFRAALTHRSAPGANNERLEFLGDAVLNLLIAHRLYDAFPGATEGELRSGGFRRQSILADAFEAVCGAVFLDGGFAAAEPLVTRLFAGRITALPDPEALKDPKTRLQEYLQSRSLTLPRYVILGVEGEDHAQIFRVSCEVPGLALRVEGSGSSRRRAEQQAAARMLEAIEAQRAPDRP